MNIDHKKIALVYRGLKIFPTWRKKLQQGTEYGPQLQIFTHIANPIN